MAVSYTLDQYVNGPRAITAKELIRSKSPT
jgi:hypothetical protein